MGSETINRVEALETGQLILGLEGCGDPIYQHVYRAAKGVYWDADRHGFKSTPMDKWPHSGWFFQIVEAVRSELGIELQLGKEVTWLNIPEHEREKIKNGDAT